VGGKTVAAVIALTLCELASAASVDPSAPVLRSSDLRPGFSVTSEGYTSNRNVASGDAVVPIPVAKLRRWDRLTGYERAFDKDSATPARNRGFFSDVSIYATAGGAKSATSFLFARFARLAPTTLTTTPRRLGSEARMCRLPAAYGATTIFVVWRSGRTQALFRLADTVGVTPTQAMRYARIMDRRMKRVR
jgi:hypothetical protein